MNHADIMEILLKGADAEKGSARLRYFRADKQSVKFLGFTAPEINAFAKRYSKELSFADLEELLKSEWHEPRSLAIRIMKLIIAKKDGAKQLENIYVIFTRNVEYIDNWALVDESAPYIPGRFWRESGDYSKFWEYADSKELFKQRIAIVSLFYNIRNYRETDMTFKIAERFLKHKHDLIHKAVGWSLREAGKVDESALLLFLDRYAPAMPRTMLRYALEKLDADKKKHYMTV
ncbi:MAG: DNA alkylation repair protein [Deferribacteraceae bacterium]|jgi:3-methyladenine DNA glycosylase AlkD|nr:DNA alkylation repair protein [Deferribacteraceae bacterium]